MSNSDVTNTQPTPIAEVTQADKAWADRIMAVEHPNNHAAYEYALAEVMAAHRLTALADAERKLEDMCASLECAAGCDEGVTKDQAYSEILSWGGSAVASSYASARQEIERLKKV